MSDTTQNNKRIAKNTFVLYIRMILLMLVSLYTSRVVLKALGVEDFGIYNIVGGLVSLLSFFISSLTNVSQRYLNIGIGKGDKLCTTNYFKQCGTILFIFSIAIFIVAETIGTWFLYEKLVIPPNRLEAAFWVYQFTLVSIVCSINQVNYLGAIIAHEKMSVYAYLGIFEAIARLATASIVIASSYDHLILYAGLVSLVSILVLVFHIVYCHRKFDICKFGFYWNKSLVTDMTKFISANIFGCFAWSASAQGTNIIINIFFGPLCNAAKGISTQIGSVVSKFTENIMTAVKPQIIKSYASGDREYMLNLINKSSKLSFFISAIIAIPFIIYTRYILQIWLGIVPEYTVAFSRIAILESLTYVFITPLWVAANATGNIKRNQIYGRIFNLLSLPISYIILCIYQNAIIPVAACTIMQYLYWFYCVYDIKKQLDLNIRNYIRSVVTPSFAMFSISLIIGYAIKTILNTENYMILLLQIASIVVIGILTAYSFMTKGERCMIKKIILKKRSKQI